MPRTIRAAEPAARYLSAAPCPRPRWSTATSSSTCWPTIRNGPSGRSIQLDALGQTGALLINPLILAELSPRFERAAELEAALAGLPLRREPLPWDAAFLAGQAFRAYRSAPGAGQGRARSPLPDFYIGAHALVAGHRLLTRDAKRYRRYSRLEIVSP